MGYDLHITRRESWYGEGAPISAIDWITYASGDPELQLDPSNGPYFAIWCGPSEIEEPWLDWANGEIYSKYPDQALAAKMLAIARHFGATVQGDDGETYRDASEISVSTNAASTARVIWSDWPLWKLLLAAFGIGCLLLGLRLLIFGQ